MSNYKVFTDLDLADNNIINVGEIQGSSRDSSEALTLKKNDSSSASIILKPSSIEVANKDSSLLIEEDKATLTTKATVIASPKTSITAEEDLNIKGSKLTIASSADSSSIEATSITSSDSAVGNNFTVGSDDENGTATTTIHGSSFSSDTSTISLTSNSLEIENGDFSIIADDSTSKISVSAIVVDNVDVKNEVVFSNGASNKVSASSSLNIETPTLNITSQTLNIQRGVDDSIISIGESTALLSQITEVSGSINTIDISKDKFKSSTSDVPSITVKDMSVIKVSADDITESFKNMTTAVEGDKEEIVTGKYTQNISGPSSITYGDVVVSGDDIKVDGSNIEITAGSGEDALSLSNTSLHIKNIESTSIETTGVNTDNLEATDISTKTVSVTDNISTKALNSEEVHISGFKITFDSTSNTLIFGV